MLTVWRKVHIEVDNMGQVQGNTITGTIVNAANPPGNATTEFFLSAGVPDHRFQPGTIVITGNGTFGVLDSFSPDAVVIDAFLKPGNVIGKSFTLVDDDDYDEDDTVDNGDSNEITIGPLNAFLKLQTSDSFSLNVYAPVFMTPVYDGGGSTSNNGSAPFVLNLATANLNNQLDLARGSGAKESDNFWVAYFQVGYQGEVFESRDPDADYGVVADKATQGYTDGNTSDATNPTCSPMPIGARGSVIYQETIRDFFHVQNSTVDNLAAPHELGHQMGLLGDASGWGLMGTDGVNPAQLMPSHVHFLRCRVKSPGM